MYFHIFGEEVRGAETYFLTALRGEGKQKKVCSAHVSKVTRFLFFDLKGRDWIPEPPKGEPNKKLLESKNLFRKNSLKHPYLYREVISVC